MTLNQLIQKAQSLNFQLSSGDIPLYDDISIEIQDVEFKVITDDDGHYIRMIVY